MHQRLGQSLGEGEWLTITQSMIDTFAEATGDHRWIHVGVERARSEMPGGKTIAHGYLTLSLLPKLGGTVYQIRQRSRDLNYGSNKVRFTGAVPAGSRVRARQVLRSSEAITGGRRRMVETTVEIEGQSQPALVTEMITQVYD